MELKLLFFVFPVAFLTEPKYNTKETEDFVTTVVLQGFKYYLKLNARVAKNCYKEVESSYEEATKIYTEKMEDAIGLFDQKYVYELHYVELLHAATVHLHTIGVKLREYQQQLKKYFDEKSFDKAKSLAREIKDIIAFHYDNFIILREDIRRRPHSAFNEYNSHVSKIRDDLLTKVEEYGDTYRKCVKSNTN